MDTFNPYISNEIICKKDQWHIVNTECVHLMGFFNKHVYKMYEWCNTDSVSDAQKAFMRSAKGDKTP